MRILFLSVFLLVINLTACQTGEKKGPKVDKKAERQGKTDDPSGNLTTPKIPPEQICKPSYTPGLVVLPTANPKDPAISPKMIAPQVRQANAEGVERDRDAPLAEVFTEIRVTPSDNSDDKICTSLGFIVLDRSYKFAASFFVADRKRWVALPTEYVRGFSFKPCGKGDKVYFWRDHVDPAVFVAERFYAAEWDASRADIVISEGPYKGLSIDDEAFRQKLAEDEKACIENLNKTSAKISQKVIIGYNLF